MPSSAYIHTGNDRKERYFCDCPDKCGRRLKEIGRTSWYTHRASRELAYGNGAASAATCYSQQHTPSETAPSKVPASNRPSPRRDVPAVAEAAPLPDTMTSPPHDLDGLREGYIDAEITSVLPGSSDAPAVSGSPLPHSSTTASNLQSILVSLESIGEPEPPDDPDALVTDDVGAPSVVRLAELKLAQEFINALEGATLDSGELDLVLCRAGLTGPSRAGRALLGPGRAGPRPSPSPGPGPGLGFQKPWAEP
ncbi:hypothetical protein CERSUDRAFT_92498 [Gelatoporia subvermispora B]|uniref:Uncharacterized protein n=1 Tax=Ceriporiopsis subvermispora (strain B) TaxID=914234 RepID=M2RNJ7_CERS8|nr:hypothetical protein CERSUDRAFT_92498 [Gelatoporia subvermispora B]